MVGQPDFFDLSHRYAALSAAGDQLERFDSVVDFEVFRVPLIVAMSRGDPDKGGRCAAVQYAQQTLRAYQRCHHHQPQLQRMGRGVR